MSLESIIHIVNHIDFFQSQQKQLLSEIPILQHIGKNPPYSIAPSEDFDQIAQKRNLIKVFAGSSLKSNILKGC